MGFVSTLTAPSRLPQIPNQDLGEEQEVGFRKYANSPLPPPPNPINQDLGEEQVIEFRKEAQPNLLVADNFTQEISKKTPSRMNSRFLTSDVG